MKNFALIGAAGYIAPRHLQAIKETGHNLVAALDKHDSVGVIDNYFPNADFFTEIERFDRHLHKLKKNSEKHIDYVSICSPNYLHDSHIRLALRNGADAICEKPLVLNPWNVESLRDVERETGHRVYTILQLRLHPALIALKKDIESTPGKIHDIDLTYITPRGKWYNYSWKGDINKSGGVASNIGIHFYDMLQWIFGDVKSNKVHLTEPDRASGVLELEKARVRWFLSINQEDIPTLTKNKDQRTFRSIQVDGREIEFSGGFTDLHTLSYQSILDGNGFGIDEAQKSIEIVHAIRNAEISSAQGDYHPFLKKI